LSGFVDEGKGGSASARRGVGASAECRWQKAPLTSRDLLELQRKISFAPEPAADVRLLFWTRTGAVEPGFPARAYSVADVIN
jgi:hypothetical protein